MFYLISKPQNQWKIKCFVRHYSTTILMTPKKKNNNITKWSKNPKNWYGA